MTINRTNANLAMSGRLEISRSYPELSDRPMNFLKKNWPSITIFITFSVLVVSLAIHSYNQPLEYDEYWARYEELDAEYDKLRQEADLLFGGLGNTTNTEQFLARINSITPEEAAAWRKEWKRWLAKSKALRRKRERLKRKKPVSPWFTPHQ